jgi:hypothetical protein
MTAFQRRRYAGGRRVDREPAASIDDLEAAQLARADREDAARAAAAAPAPAPTPTPKPTPKQELGPRMGPSIRPHSATLVPESVLPRAASPEPAPAPTPVPAALPEPSPAPAAAPKIEPPVRVGPVTLTLPEGVEKVVFHMGSVAPSDPDAITDTADLRAFLIGTMKRANEGRLSPTIVESVCKLADRVMQATQLELEAERVLHESGRSSLRAIDLVGDPQ